MADRGKLKVLSRKGSRVCGKCGGRKGFYSQLCRGCQEPNRPNLGKTGAAHSAWKGGSDLDRDGYVRTYAPDHPWPRSNGYVREHIRVMELHIGRRIRPHEIVHHRDHDKQHNELDNLELMSRGEHSAHHRAHDTHLRKRNQQGQFA